MNQHSFCGRLQDSTSKKQPNPAQRAPTAQTPWAFHARSSLTPPPAESVSARNSGVPCLPQPLPAGGTPPQSGVRLCAHGSPGPVAQTVQTFTTEVAAKFAAHATGHNRQQWQRSTPRLDNGDAPRAGCLQITPSSGPAMKPGLSTPPASSRSHPCSRNRRRSRCLVLSVLLR